MLCFLTVNIISPRYCPNFGMCKDPSVRQVVKASCVVSLTERSKLLGALPRGPSPRQIQGPCFAECFTVFLYCKTGSPSIYQTIHQSRFSVACIGETRFTGETTVGVGERNASPKHIHRSRGALQNAANSGMDAGLMGSRSGYFVLTLICWIRSQTQLQTSWKV